MCGFTGSMKELLMFLELDLFIGISGESLSTQHRCTIMRQIPVEKLVIMSGSPGNLIENDTHACGEVIKTQIPFIDKE
jgi:Tat protein secretion system quality control protein TatD with DNase activity